MITYVIERTIPGAGKLTKNELQAISTKSCSVINKLGANIRWLQSYVTQDTIFCIYEAKNEGLIKQHAQQGGFPADRIVPVVNIISPATAGGPATS